MAGRTVPAVVEETEDEGQQGLDLGKLPNMVGYVARRAQLKIFEDFIRTMATIDLRPASFSVLAVIEANPGSTQSAVSAALGLQRTNLVAIIDQLEERGLARRAPAKADKRSHALTLTPKGKRLLDQAMELQGEHERRVLAPLTPDEGRQLLDYLHRMIAGSER